MSLMRSAERMLVEFWSSNELVPLSESFVRLNKQAGTPDIVQDPAY